MMSAACQEEQGGSFHPLELMSYRKTSTPFQPCFNCPQTLMIQEGLPALPLPATAVATMQALGTLQGLSHLGFPSLLTRAAPVVVVQRGQGDSELAGPSH